MRKLLLLSVCLTLAILVTNDPSAAAGTVEGLGVVEESPAGVLAPPVEVVEREVFRSEVVLEAASPTCAEAIASDDDNAIRSECLDNQPGSQQRESVEEPSFDADATTTCVAVGVAFISTGIVFDIKGLNLNVGYGCNDPIGPVLLLGCSASNIGTAVPLFAADVESNLNLLTPSDRCFVYTEPTQSFFGTASFVAGGSLVGVTGGVLPFVGSFGPVGYQAS